MYISEALFPILAALIADILAQVLKVPCYYLKTKKWDLLWMFASGGFPSSHSATVAALSIAVGLDQGFDSVLFAITGVFSVIVMYDACHVRYYSGKGIELTQQLIQDLSANGMVDLENPIYFEKLKTVLGHKNMEVVGGLVLGVIVALVMACFVRP